LPELTVLEQEVNPSLMAEFDVQQTVSVGCSLVRSALGKPRVRHRVTLLTPNAAGETLL
jgi:hypothetical protein